MSSIHAPAARTASHTGGGDPGADLPVIGATIGDPGGIGPEVCVKAIADRALADVCRPVLIGSVDVVRQAAGYSGVDLPVVALTRPDPTQLRPGTIPVLDPGGFPFGSLRLGEPSAASGESVFDAMALGARLGEAGVLRGLVWGPVNTDSLLATGRIREIDDLQPAGSFMLRLTGPLRIVPLSEHLPLADALALVTPERVLALVRLVDATLKSWGMARPRIAVAGINPHAMFEDDRTRIAPAVQAARDQGIDVDGPVGPDSVFRMAIDGRFDAIVTAFHDQGQIVVKTVGFAGACTVYIGLPYVLLNVPHGTAYDIAGRGVAQHRSMVAAFRTAAALASGRLP